MISQNLTEAISSRTENEYIRLTKFKPGLPQMKIDVPAHRQLLELSGSSTTRVLIPKA
jgi:hypothetical protein